MFNIMLDPVPVSWEGFLIDPDFRIGIQMCQIVEDRELSNTERYSLMSELFFPGVRPDISEQIEAVKWFLTGWNHDRNRKSKDTARVLDYDIDQWRIYSAFRSQYGIDLNTASLHYWQFMGLLTTLNDCAFTKVVDIRIKKVRPKMPKEEKEAIAKAKQVYGLEPLEKTMSEGEKERQQEAIELFNKMRKAKP